MRILVFTANLFSGKSDMTNPLLMSPIDRFVRLVWIKIGTAARGRYSRYKSLT
jgi:hypothetical protein